MALLTDNHFTPIVGMDIHATLVPPYNPFHPFVGVILDPMDYIPFIGATVFINNKRRGVFYTTGVLGTRRHIALVGRFANPLIEHESMNFFSSETVYAEGSRLSPKGHMVMSCNDIGVPMPIIEPGKCKFSKFKMTSATYAPTSYSISINSGSPVYLAPPYSPPNFDDMEEILLHSFGFGCIKVLGGKFMLKASDKISHKLGAGNKIGRGAKKVSNWLRSLGFEPIDLVTGAMTYPGVDFELQGPIPFSWERVWDSNSDFVGMLGHGVSLKYDRSVDFFPEQEAIGLRFDDGRMLAFPMLDRGETHYLRQEKTSLTRTEKGGFIAYAHQEDLYYHFEFQTTHEKNTQYKLTKIQDPRGFSIEFKYENNRVTKIIDAAHRHLLIHYNAQDFVDQVELETRVGKQRMVSYDYDALGNMTAITDALGQTTVMEYQEHLMVKKTDRNGQAFYWEYQGIGIQAQCIHTWGDHGWQEGWVEYHTEEGYNKVTDANGIVSYYYFTPEGLVTQIKNGEGDSSYTQYTDFMEVYREIDAEGNVTGYTYDDKGNQTSIVYPDGSSRLFMYNDQGRLALTIDPEGNKRNYTYKRDQPHLINSIIEPDNSQTVLEYNEQQLVCEVRNNNKKSSLLYDEMYQLIELKDQDNTTTSWMYDYKGRVANISTNGKTQQSFLYDALGRVIRINNNGQPATHLKYNAYDEVIEAFGDRTNVKFSYTPLGSLLSREENNTKVAFTYDKMEQLKSIKNEHDETYHFVRNKNGDIVEETGFDSLTRFYRRDRAGKVIKVEHPNNKYSEYEYNALGQVSRIEYHDGTWETFSYNKNGQLIEARNQNSAVFLERDVMGRVVNEKQSTGIPNDKGYSIESNYTPNGNRAQITSSLGANIQHEYNSYGLCTHTQGQQGDSSLYKAELQYNALGHEIERIVTGGVTSKRTYDDAGRQRTHQVHGKSRSYRNTKYLWEPNNQLHQILDISNNTNTQFTYDAIGNLASARYADASYDYKLPDEVGNLYKTKEKKDRKYGKGGRLIEDNNWHYLYDDQGNLIKKTKNNTQQILAEFKKEQEKKLQQPPEKSYWIDRIFGLKDQVKTPDLSPKTESDVWQYGEWQYTWQANGMLKSVQDPKGKVTTFEYDALGRRTTKINHYEKQINRYIYDGNVLLHEFSYASSEKPKVIADELGRLSLDKEENTENLITWVFDEGSFVPQAKITNEGTFSIISDYLGTPILSFDEQGNKVWERELDIYGRVRKGDNSFVPFLYQGQYYDEETDLAYNRFRYYSPDTGMYISQDPIGLAGGMPNMYAYVYDNNSQFDPLGLIGAPATVPSSPGIYSLSNTTTNQAYVGSALDANGRMSNTSHTKAQDLLGHPDTKVEFTPVDLGDADTWKDQNRILRHYEQKEKMRLENSGFYMTNSNNPEAATKNKRNKGIVKDKGASSGKRIECN